ncbi:amidohydrolase [Nocardioides marmoriginsengisoli]|uniref:Amidohydrolase n=1 Tax=Nocardioides marmoriginsengisoli TaxID=661483 RepID=A0A3N0CBV3_9ACTN|nr:amidohydrolase [Nocardioides marmoriginsengisoli]RNL60546.1 amidohydrolase [Nocardioides marmoriginsengisoli]
MPQEQNLAIDVHQHLWTDEFVDRLRARTQVPYLRGWTLHTAAEPPYEVDPGAHDVTRRIAADHEAEVGTACLSLSAPLGIEDLPRPQAALLIDAWHRGVRELPDHFRAWASVPSEEPDVAALHTLLAEDRFVGLQLPANAVSSPAAWERVAGLLLAAEVAGKPVMIHPGPQEHRPQQARVPDWWHPVVGYVAQLNAAWWGWQAVDGRSLFRDLRIVFAAGAGLAPVHQERQIVRGGTDRPVDPNVFVDTSSYGPRALDALVRVLGIDALVLGSDRPYGAPVAEFLGDAATHALRVRNPRRLIEPAPAYDQSWAVAS